MLSPSGSLTLPELDPELSAVLKRAAKAARLEWNSKEENHRVLFSLGWMIGISGRAVLVFSPPSQYPSFPKCMENLLGRGRHLLLPKTD